jgi:hypothetical protein
VDTEKSSAIRRTDHHEAALEVLAADPFTARRPPSTRHPRCTHEFIALLQEDFGITRHALINAFMGMPAEPKKQAIAVCEWAIRAEDPARALLAWARKHGRGTFRPDGADETDEDEGRS